MEYPETLPNFRRPQRPWPKLSYADCRDTYETLHRWVQIVGKTKMANAPWTNHSWHTTLHVTPSGLSTLPFQNEQGDAVSIELNFSNHTINFRSSSGLELTEPLRSETVASFYQKTQKALEFLNVKAKFDLRPSELDTKERFDKDTVHRSYNPFFVTDFWQALVAIDLTFKEFRAEFAGKSSPSHFFWGSFDLALTRFSGKEAPEHPGGFPNMPDKVVREAYSDELASFGFFPGNDSFPTPAFYSYAYPEPKGLDQTNLGVEGAYYNKDLREFILPYEEVFASENPKGKLLSFLRACYEAIADKGAWDRERLEGSSYLKQLQQERRRLRLQ